MLMARAETDIVFTSIITASAPSAPINVCPLLGLARLSSLRADWPPPLLDAPRGQAWRLSNRALSSLLLHPAARLSAWTPTWQKSSKHVPSSRSCNLKTGRQDRRTSARPPRLLHCRCRPVPPWCHVIVHGHAASEPPHAHVSHASSYGQHCHPAHRSVPRACRPHHDLPMRTPRPRLTAAAWSVRAVGRRVHQERPAHGTRGRALAQVSWTTAHSRHAGARPGWVCLMGL
mmetsp:Transcript_22825/g.69856  ORF Transcript_22825/g.69856 Transcript_22825/m.69856 type:complete len:231 (-) Transcript_22825:27-719(-)